MAAHRIIGLRGEDLGFRLRDFGVLVEKFRVEGDDVLVTVGCLNGQ